MTIAISASGLRTRRVMWGSDRGRALVHGVRYPHSVLQRLEKSSG